MGETACLTVLSAEGAPPLVVARCTIGIGAAVGTERMPFFDISKRLQQILTLRQPIQVRGSLAILLALVVGLAGLPSSAQITPSDGLSPVTGDLSDEIDKLKKEQEEVKKQKEEQSKKVDTATAEASQLASALAVLNKQVNEQEAKLATAQSQLDQAEASYAEARKAVVAKSSQIANLEDQVSSLAVAAFIDHGTGGGGTMLNTSDPQEAIFIQSLVDSVGQQDLNAIDELEEARADLAVDEARADSAQAEADRVTKEIARQLSVIQGTRDEQNRLTLEAEDRLERQLAEAAVLAEKDKTLSDSLSEKNDELARQAALARKKNNPAPTTTSNTKYPTASQIVDVQGFWVHEDVAENLDSMLDAARADGIEFGGWAYRDHQTQIRLRRSHCGTSEYAIWQKPSSTCSPPTARPGKSQHELGKAIDFTYGGSTINSRKSAGFKWLKNNAANYGFYNLPSEPWHWSVNGR